MKKKTHQKFLTVGTFLKQKRLLLGLSHSALATSLGYSSAQLVSDWERGIVGPPEKTLKTLIKELKLKSDELIDVILLAERTHLEELFEKTKVKVPKNIETNPEVFEDKYSSPRSDKETDPENPFSIVGTFLHEKRIASGLSQATLAALLGFKTPQLVSNWERGTSSAPEKILPLLSKILKIKSSELIEYLLNAEEHELSKLLREK